MSGQSGHLEHYLRLALADGLGPVTLRRLLDAAGSAEDACNVPLSLLRCIEGIGPARAEKIRRGLQEATTEAPRQLQLAADRGARIICVDDEEYPPLLRSIHDPPPVLFVLGAMEPRDLNAIAIVGSRGCSYYGREQANRFGAALAGMGFTIISGGARGIDSSAHQGALAHPDGRTIAVLGCGIDVVYPPENTKLFEQIAQKGAIISEYPMGSQPLPENFPRRNRIVSGMSRGVFVVEADEKSGALITANTACDQNRSVFAMPGRVDNKLSAGPHKLLKEGATIATCAQDIVDGLSALPADVCDAPDLFQSKEQAAPASPAPNVPPLEAKPLAVLSQRQKQILNAIEDATAVDAIVERTALPAHIILQELTMLSLKGAIARVDGQTYRRK